MISVGVKVIWAYEKGISANNRYSVIICIHNLKDSSTIVIYLQRLFNYSMLALFVNLLNVMVDGPTVKIICMNLLPDVLKCEQSILK